MLGKASGREGILYQLPVAMRQRSASTSATRRPKTKGWVRGTSGNDLPSERWLNLTGAALATSHKPLRAAHTKKLTAPTTVPTPKTMPERTDGGGACSVQGSAGMPGTLAARHSSQVQCPRPRRIGGHDGRDALWAIWGQISASAAAHADDYQGYTRIGCHRIKHDGRVELSC